MAKKRINASVTPPQAPSNMDRLQIRIFEVSTCSSRAVFSQNKRLIFACWQKSQEAFTISANYPYLGCYLGRRAEQRDKKLSLLLL